MVLSHLKGNSLLCFTRFVVFLRFLFVESVLCADLDLIVSFCLSRWIFNLFKRNVLTLTQRPIIIHFVQKNSEFTPFSWDRKKYWYQGWIAYLKYFWIICRINWLKGWNNFSKVFFFCHIVLFITFYKTYLSNYLLCLCLAEILFEDTSVAFISLWRYTVLLPVIRWLPEDGDGSQVYHCV